MNKQAKTRGNGGTPALAGAPAEPEEMPRTIKAFVGFTFHQIVRQRKWLLLPLWVTLAVVAALLVLSGNSHLLPVIYLAF